MPTVLTIFGLRVVIYTNDHRPAHIHVMGNGCEAVFYLRCPEGPPMLRENYGFPGRELARIGMMLATALVALCNDWRKLHGAH